MKTYVIHDILSIRTNVNIPVPEYFLTEQEVQEPDIELLQEELHYNQVESKKKRSGVFFYWIEDSALIIQYEIPLPNAQLIIDDLEGKTKIKFTKAFLKYWNIIKLFGTLLPIKFIQKGYALIHTGCLNHRGKAILFVALFDTGKTSTVLSLLDGKNFRFMSDDLTIIAENGEVYSYPQKVSISPYTLIGNLISLSNDPISKIKRRLARSRFEILFRDILKIRMDEKKEVPRGFIDDKSTIKKIFVLSGGEDEIREIGGEEIARKILVNTLELFNSFRNYYLNFYYYIFDFDILRIFDKHKDIIYRAVEAIESIEIKSNSVEAYSNKVSRILDSSK